MRRDIHTRFHRALKKHGLVVQKRVGDASFMLRTAKGQCTVSLTNVARNINRDGDLSAIDRFVSVVAALPEDPPSWQLAAARLRVSLEPSDSALDGIAHQTLTQAVCRVLTHTDDDESRISWVSHTLLTSWSVSVTAAFAAALDNMDRLLATAPLEISDADGVRLGMLATHSPFKASLLVAPSLRSVVEPALGWPVFAVAPCRDFIYLFSDETLIPRLGAVVVREYRGSGYPISTEVLRVSDDGVVALGSFGT